MIYVQRDAKFGNIFKVLFNCLGLNHMSNYSPDCLGRGLKCGCRSLVKGNGIWITKSLRVSKVDLTNANIQLLLSALTMLIRLFDILFAIQYIYIKLRLTNWIHIYITYTL